MLEIRHLHVKSIRNRRLQEAAERLHVAVGPVASMRELEGRLNVQLLNRRTACPPDHRRLAHY